SPEAQDLVQGFFAHLLEQNTLSRADQKKGRLRTFLLGSLQNFLYNEYDRAHRLKRGGGHRIVSIDEHLPEAEASMMDTAHLSDSRGYDLAWASNIVKRAWQHLQNVFEAEGKAEWLEVLRPFVTGSGRTPPDQQPAVVRTSNGNGSTPGDGADVIKRGIDLLRRPELNKSIAFTETCPTCGGPLTQGECLRCLISLGFLSDSQQPEKSQTGRRLTP